MEIFMNKLYLYGFLALASFDTYASANCARLNDPIQQLQCFATEQKSPMVKDQALDHKLANKLGPERTVACMYSSFRMVGALNKSKKGSDEYDMKLGFMAYSKVFSAMTKKYGDNRVKPYLSDKQQWAKNSSFEEVSKYYSENCDHPEVAQLAKQGYQ
jgi:hypothetical protein